MLRVFIVSAGSALVPLPWVNETAHQGADYFQFGVGMFVYHVCRMCLSLLCKAYMLSGFRCILSFSWKFHRSKQGTCLHCGSGITILSRTRSRWIGFPTTVLQKQIPPFSNLVCGATKAGWIVGRKSVLGFYPMSFPTFFFARVLFFVFLPFFVRVLRISHRWATTCSACPSAPSRSWQTPTRWRRRR